MPRAISCIKDQNSLCILLAKSVGVQMVTLTFPERLALPRNYIFEEKSDLWVWLGERLILFSTHTHTHSKFVTSCFTLIIRVLSFCAWKAKSHVGKMVLATLFPCPPEGKSVAMWFSSLVLHVWNQFIGISLRGHWASHRWRCPVTLQPPSLAFGYFLCS
jgi:hypothetical protein